MNKICIALSTYNGERYIKEQLDSILSQSCENFIILVRDDNSNDKTLEILSSYDIKVIDEKKNLGIKKSFAFVMQYSFKNLDSDYLMFSDQDDIWDANKVKTTYQKMQELENIYGMDTPLLVHGDLTVVDENLEVIASSFWKYQNIDPSKDSLNHLLLHNTVTGCTMMINRSLAEKIKNIPSEGIMHDWWIAMVASAFGKIAYIDESLMLYRQHGKNDTGAKHYGVRYFIKKVLTKPLFEKYIYQSRAFLKLYGHELDEYHKSMLEEFSSFDGLSKLQKLRVLFKYKIWKNGFMRNLGLVVFV